jgi:eukaryotic-like serine/threonine-protein kinase
MSNDQSFRNNPTRPVEPFPGASPNASWGSPPQPEPAGLRNQGERRFSCGVLAIILTLALLVLAGIGAVGVLFGPQLLGWKEAPNLIGLPQDHAAHYLIEAGLPYQVAEVTAASSEANGIVLDQSPLPGQYISPSSQVILSIGRYTELMPTPSQTPAEPAAQAESPTAAVETPSSEAEPPGAASGTPTEGLPTATPEPTTGPYLIGGGRGQIAFASDRGGSVQIWLLTLEGGEPQQLTDVEGGACQPAWSPDGSQLVFISPCTGEEDFYPAASLWLIQADGSGLEALPSSAAGDYDPAWSPDGALLAFTSRRDNDLAHIYLMKMSDRTVESFTTAATHEMQPAWSSNGDRLAYIMPSSGGYTIYLKDLVNGKAEQFSRETDRANAHPGWSPDGTYIIYTQQLPSGFPGMVSATLAQKGFDAQPLLAPLLQPSRQAVFSPDGGLLACEGWPDGANHDIWIMTSNAASPQQVTDDPGFDFDPAWRP